MSKPNDGILVTGGTINSQQIAVGQNATATYTTYNHASQLKENGHEELASSLSALMASLEAHSNQIKDYEEVAQAVHMIAEETKKDKPNKLTLKSLLQSVKESVNSVADIAIKLGLLQKAIGLLIGTPLP